MSWNIMHNTIVKLTQDKDFIPEKPFWENLYAIMIRELTLMDVEIPERRNKIDGRDLLALIELKSDVVDITRSAEDMTIFDIALILAATHVAQVGTKILIKYNLISAGNVYDFVDYQKHNLFDLYDCILRECRGIVVDLASGELLLAPYRKFANMGEWKETQQEVIEEKMQNAKVVEFSNKLDGSLIIARYVQNEILICSSGNMDKEIAPHISIAREYLANENYQKFLRENPNFTCMFELIDRRDTHVVPVGDKECGLYLTGMRDIRDGSQKSYREVLKIAKSYHLLATSVFDKSFVEILEMRDSVSHKELEGFVLNIDGYYVKIKCEDYLKFQRVRNNVSINDLIPILLEEKQDDFLAYLNEKDKLHYGALLDDLIRRRQNILDYVDEVCEKAPKTSRKDTAIWVIQNCKKEYRGYVMMQLDGDSFEPFIKRNYPYRYIEFIEHSNHL